MNDISNPTTPAASGGIQNGSKSAPIGPEAMNVALDSEISVVLFHDLEMSNTIDDPNKGSNDCKAEMYEALRKIDPRPNEAMLRGVMPLQNSEKNNIYRLPNDVLLMVVRFVSEDAVWFFFVRQVSRRFRQLAGDKEFRNHVFSTYHECEICDGAFMGCRMFPREEYFARISSHPESYHLKRRSWACLRNSRLCNSCQKGDEDRQALMGGGGIPCKFSAPGLSSGYLDCSGCKSTHPSTMFSSQQVRKQGDERICIAREGHVRLCDHEFITWADIESWAQQESEPGKEKEATIKLCKHQSHALGCKEDTWPRAKLYREHLVGMVLTLSWNPHTGHSRFSSYDDKTGRIQASEMGDVIKTYRHNAARFMAPEAYPGHVPEAACFGTAWHDCLGDTDKGTKSSSPTIKHPTSPKRACHIAHGQPGRDVLVAALVHSEIEIDQCGLDVPGSGSGSGSRCLKTSYRRNIYCGLYADGSGDLMPDHSWYHALDGRSYDWSCHKASGARDTCADTSCWNHYPRFGHCVGTKRCKPKPLGTIL